MRAEWTTKLCETEQLQNSGTNEQHISTYRLTAEFNTQSVEAYFQEKKHVTLPCCSLWDFRRKKRSELVGYITILTLGFHLKICLIFFFIILRWRSLNYRQNFSVLWGLLPAHLSSLHVLCSRHMMLQCQNHFENLKGKRKQDLALLLNTVSPERAGCVMKPKRALHNSGTFSSKFLPSCYKPFRAILFHHFIIWS